MTTTPDPLPEDTESPTSPEDGEQPAAQPGELADDQDFA